MVCELMQKVLADRSWKEQEAIGGAHAQALENLFHVMQSALACNTSPSDTHKSLGASQEELATFVYPAPYSRLMHAEGESTCV